jgi:uncharacterized protein (TIGR03083 family)
VARDRLDYAAALVEQNRLLSEVLFAADLATPVPTCPGWTLLHLLRHVGRGDRWAAQIVTDRAAADLDPRLVRDGRPPDDLEGARAWLLASPRTVIDAVAAAGADTVVSTFLGPRPAAWWIRRRLHEATVHRADAAVAAGAGYVLAGDLAADGIDECLDVLAGRRAAGAAEALGGGATIALDAIDLDDDPVWLISGRPDGISWSRGDDRRSATVRLTGTATDLFLAVVHRRTVEEGGVRLDGDADRWRTWSAHTPL